MTSNKKLQVPWLPAPVWKDFPMTKGLNHHRIPVGIIVAADEEITCFLESKSLVEVQVRFFNDDSETENIYIIKDSFPGRAAILGVSSVSVPFVDCEYLKETPRESRTLSIDYPSDSKILPIYHFGDNEDDFFMLWDTQDAEFAYIESDYFGFLIPKIDKEATRELPGGNHLDDLIAFYDEILIIYNHLIGLSFEETATNQNVRNRFFIKANKSGDGMAYYCDWCTAVTSGSIESFWLDISSTNWGALHEIGHGHELKCLNDETLSVSEVWNNILVVFYQTIMFGSDVSTKCTKREDMDIVEAIGSDVPVKDWGLFHKLSFLLHMFVKAGQKSFPCFNQLIRQELDGHFHYASGTAFVEKLMHFFAIDFDIDVYPFMKLAKAAIAEEQLLEHYYVLSSVAYPLNYLINDTEELEIIKNKLNLWFETSLVTPLDLRPAKLKNDFTVKIEHHLFDHIFGDMLKLMDGSRTIAEKRILNQTIIFTNIPVGVYKVFVTPNVLNAKLIYNDFYAVVHASKPSDLFLTAKKMKAPSLLRDKIKFLGLGENHFATLSVDPLRRFVRFHVFSNNPHDYYKNENYVSVIIKNEKNEVIFSKTLEGDNCEIGMHNIYMDGPLMIELFHAETEKRLKTDDPIMDEIIDHDSNTNYLIANEFGFQKENTPKELLEKRFLNRIELIANKIRKKSSLHKRPFCHPKYNLLLAVETFEHMFRRNCFCLSLREQYKDCFQPEYSNQLVNALVNLNRTPNIKISKNKYCCHLTNSNTGRRTVLLNDESSILSSTITFLGSYDKLVAKLFVDASECAVNFHVLDSEPHYRYSEETYIEITIRNKENEVIFTKTLQGSDAVEEEYKINFTDLVEIDLFHAEPTRLLFDHPALGKVIEKNSSLNTLILTKELFNVNYIYEIRQTDTGEKLLLANDESVISCSKLNFLGLNDKYVATLYIDTEKSLIHFNVLSTNPHRCYEGEPYCGVKVRNSKKEIIFDKLIEGLHPMPEEFKIPFVQRAELEVFHAEPTRLRSNNLAMEGLIDHKSSTNNFSLSREISSEYYVYDVTNANLDQKVEFPFEILSTPASIFKFKGKSDRHIASLYLDLHNDRILYHVLSPEPHDRFEDEVYIGVTIYSEDKEVIFCKEIIGVDDTEENFTVSFTGRIEVKIFHAEPTRLVSDNPEIENMIDHENTENNFIIEKSLNFHRKGKNKKHAMKRSLRRKSV